MSPPLAARRTATHASSAPAIATAASTKCRKRGTNVGSESAAQAWSATLSHRPGCMWSRLTATWMPAITTKQSRLDDQHAPAPLPARSRNLAT